MQRRSKRSVSIDNQIITIFTNATRDNFEGKKKKALSSLLKTSPASRDVVVGRNRE